MYSSLDPGRFSRAQSTLKPRQAAACRCHCAHPLIPWIHRRLTADLSRRRFLGGSAAMLVPFLAAGAAGAGVAGAERAAAAGPAAHAGPATGPATGTLAAAAGKPLVLANIRLFDGLELALQKGRALRIEGNRIRAIDATGADQGDAHVIDCGGRVVMPGLIDAHWHALLCGVTQTMAMTAEVPYLHLVAGHVAGDTLMRGFTTIRDAGGPSFSLKAAIDQGLIRGPRIYPSGAMISQTSGHGDFRLRYELPAIPDILGHAEKAGVASIANGVPMVLQRVREQLMLGASQIKLMAGGGVASPYDPIASLQFTPEELHAGVQAARDWGTYAMAHVYTSEGIQRAIRAGVQSIEHGQLADEATVRMMADEGIWWSLQPFLADEDSNVYPDNPHARIDQERVAQGTVRAYEMARRFGVKTAWGTDILFNPAHLGNHGRMLAKMTRFYPPLEVLRMATGRNGELLALSALRNPYDGRLGVLEAGALADLLVIDGEPEENLDFIVEPEVNLRIIMKDGQIFKNSLVAEGGAHGR
ncbi:amidohydrolase family protein [Castellaniella sp.]|uniref:metal-dependent hydrolase family protein n=1 Tax=Castellaniella sp. TaxID=1955812 RepID=UPI003567FB5B